MSRTALFYCLLVSVIVAFYGLLYFLFGYQIPMYDSSDEPIYSSVIGKQFRLKEDLHALGISSSNHPPAEYVVLVGGVGFSNREVVSRSKFKKGTVIQVKKVETSKSILFSRIRFVVHEVGSYQLAGEKIEIGLYDKIEGPNYGLDTSYFEIVDKTEEVSVSPGTPSIN